MIASSVARRLFAAAINRLHVTVHVATGADARPVRLGLGGPEMTIHRPEEFFARIGTGGLIGFGEAYLTRAWDAEDLGAFLTVLAAELPTLVPAPLQRLRAAYVARPPRHQQGSVANSRSNIGHHYDLSNELFETFLDETLTYSSALFDSPVVSRGDHLAALPPALDGVAAPGVLREAQGRKIERLLDDTGVGAGTRLLEIGTGWGELAIRAARRGATVRSVTLSVEQQSLARAARGGGRGGRRVPRRPGLDRAVRLPAGHLAGRVRRDLLDRDDRGRRLRLLVGVLHHPGPAAGPRRTGGHPGDHHAARPDARHPSYLHLDQQVHLPRRLPPVGGGHRPDHPRRHHAADDRPALLRQPLRRDAARLGHRLHVRPGPGPATSASTRPSSGCGTSTSSTPSRASPPATST